MVHLAYPHHYYLNSLDRMYREATSPLMTGISHAVYYHVPNVASGWVRYGNAFQAGHVKTITP
jgi:hypothetical protein